MFEVAVPPRVSDNEEGIKEVKKRRVSMLSCLFTLHCLLLALTLFTSQSPSFFYFF